MTALYPIPALIGIAVASEKYGVHKVVGGILVALILAGIIAGCAQIMSTALP